MSIRVEVALLSGRSATLEVEPDSSIDSLKKRAERELGVAGKLVTSAGVGLKGEASIAEVGLQNEEVLSLWVAH